MLIASGKSPITYTSGTLFRIIPRARGGGISNVFMANPRFGRTVRIPQVVTATNNNNKKARTASQGGGKVVLQRVRRVGALVAFSTIKPEILEMVQEDLTAMVSGALLDTYSLSLIATTATTIKLQPNRIS